MRALGRIATGLGIVLVTASVAAWLVPPLLDWTRYRDAIATLATERLGRTVRIDGPVSLSLLPEPILAASAVSVDAHEAGDGTDAGGRALSIGMRQMRLRVGLAALLSGRIDARDLVLRGLDVRLPWPFDISVDAWRSPAWLSSLSARVEDGRVAIGNLVFTGVNATVSTGGLTGSYQAAGTATLSGRVWRFTVRATQPGADGSAGIDATLDGQGPLQDVGLVLTGQLDGAGAFGGRVVARGPDLSQLLPAPRVAFRADGRVTVAAGLAAADDLTVEIGGSPARGAVALRLSPTPRLDVALAAGRIDLDAWLPTLLRGGVPGLPLGLDLSAEAADFATGIVRRLRVAVDIDGAATTVRELQAVLPGDAALRLAGTVRAGTATTRPRFEGDGHLTAPALRSTFTWLERAGVGAFAGLPPEVLRSAELEGHAVLDGTTLTLDDMAGRIDAVPVVGTLAARIGGRLGLAARLHVDDLALDPWLAAPERPANQGGDRPRGFDVDMRLDAARATSRGLALAPFVLDGAADGATLTLRRLELGAGEARLIASGSMSDTGRIADAKLDIQARQAEPLAAWLPEPAASWLRNGPALMRSPLRLQVSGAGPLDAVNVRVLAELGDLRMEGQPTVDLGRARWSGPITVRHPGAPRLAEAAGLAGATAWLGDGSLALVATLTGSSGRIAAESFDLTAGGLHATGQASLDERSGAPVLTGRISAERLPLPLPYARSPTPLPLAGLRGWTAAIDLRADQVLVGSTPVLDTVTTAIDLRDGVLRLERFAGRVGGGTVTGSVSLDTQTSLPALRIGAKIEGAMLTGPLLDTSLDLVAGRLDATMALGATGHAPAALLATLAGTIALDVAGGTLSGINLAGIALSGLANRSDQDVSAELAGGSTPFQRLTLAIRISSGIATLNDATLAAPGMAARVSGAFDVAGGLADLRLAATPMSGDDAPEVAVRLTGPPDHLRRTPELAGLAGWRTRHPGAPASSQ